MRVTRSPLGAAASSRRRSAVEPTSRPARSRQWSHLPEAKTRASEDTRFLSPVRAAPTPSSPTRDPRRRATSVICEPAQASATPKGGLSPGAFHRRRASSRSLPHRSRSLPDESGSNAGNALVTLRPLPLHRGPMTGLPSAPGLDAIGSSTLASFFPRGTAAPRQLLRSESRASCSATFEAQSTRHAGLCKKKKRDKASFFLPNSPTAFPHPSPQARARPIHRFSPAFGRSSPSTEGAHNRYHFD